jgi:hypothetical protein
MLCKAQALLSSQSFSEYKNSFNRYSLSISSPAAFGTITAGVQPTYFAQGGYFEKPFLRFLDWKTNPERYPDLIGPAGGSVSFTHGITIIFVVWLQ